LSKAKTARAGALEYSQIEYCGRDNTRASVPVNVANFHQDKCGLALYICIHFYISRNMEITFAISAFSALSQEIRLRIFRELIATGNSGLAAGELSTTLDVLPNTLSTNLSILLQAGLVSRERQGRSIRYFADIKGIQRLLKYLMQDCCGGRPDLCVPFLNDLTRESSAPCD